MGLPARKLEPAETLVESPDQNGESRMTNRDIIARLRHAVQQANGETVARGIGVHRSQLGRIIDGERAISADFRAKALEWFRIEDLRARDEQAGLATRGTLVKTAVARELCNIVTVCQVQRGIGLIQGPAGVGKTGAARWYASLNPSAVYLTVSAANNSPNRMIEALWYAAGFRYRKPAPRNKPKSMPGGRANRTAWAFKPKCHHRGVVPTASSQYADIVKAWKVADGGVSNRAIFIDQAHLLRDATVEVIQSIHDETGVAIVFLATNRFEKFDAGGGDRQMYEQMVSRICCRRNFVRPLAEDVDRVAKSLMPAGAKLTPAGRKFLLDMAASPRSGGLRRVGWDVLLAYKLDQFSPERGQPLDEVHLRNADRYQASTVKDQ